MTTLSRTVADLVGRLPLESAVALADRGFAIAAYDAKSRTVDHDAADEFRAELLARPALSAGARGCVQARWVVAFADGRAGSPLESVSRLYFHLLGFAPPTLQVRIPHAAGFYEIDFGLDDVGVWGEVDGLVKYTDAVLLGDRTSAAVVLAEKQREDDIRGRTGRRLVRWGADDLRDVHAFRARLAAFGIRSSGPAIHPPPTFLAGRP